MAVRNCWYQISLSPCDAAQCKYIQWGVFVMSPLANDSLSNCRSRITGVLYNRSSEFYFISILARFVDPEEWGLVFNSGQVCINQAVCVRNVGMLVFIVGHLQTQLFTHTHSWGIGIVDCLESIKTFGQISVICHKSWLWMVLPMPFLAKPWPYKHKIVLNYSQWHLF